METEMINIPLLKKLNIKRSDAQVAINTEASCCTPKANNIQCCSPSQSEEAHDGACCAQPEDGSACCNK